MAGSNPSSKIHLRLAAPADVPAIVAIEHLSFIHAGERFGERHVRYLIGSPRAIVTVAEVDGKIVGWSAAFAWLRGQRPWGRIYAVAVHPEARGRRLGPLLLQDAIQALRQRGAGPIFLEVRPDNHPAIRLYEKSGFVFCKTLPNYYGQDRPAQRMVRND